MSNIEAIILGIIQGITEFFPISSSGHLALTEAILKIDTEGLFFFNILVHIATLLAILIYFRKRIWQILVKKQFTVMAAIIIGTIPAVIVGLTLKDNIETLFASPKIVLISMLATALFFIAAETLSPRKKDQRITILRGLTIGIAQAAALIPGISRSGSTLATGLLTKMDRETAAEFSFLLGIPAIAGAGLLSALDLSESTTPENWTPHIIGFIAALISGYIAISILMRLYKKHSLIGFSIYLIIISIIGNFILA